MPVKKYPKEVKEFIAENIKGTRIKNMVELVNQKFGFDFTYTKMRSYLKNHNLRNDLPKGLTKGRPTELYPAEVKQFISENYKGVGHKDMANMLNNRFSTSYTEDQVKAYYARNKLDSGLTGQFEKGIIPWNKGMKGLQIGGKETQYKKGDKPANWVPIGSERINGDGYVDVKVADGQKWKNWKGKHILIREKHNGPVPEGYVVIFGDMNNRNFDINNLILVSRKQLLVLNRKGLIQKDADLTRTGLIVADIYSKIAEKK